MRLFPQNACETLKARLKPYKDANPSGTWREWVTAAYFDRTSLSTTGFYKSVSHAALVHGFDVTSFLL